MQETDVSRMVMRFGSCQLHLHRRELQVKGTPVHIGSRAFDVLQLLVEARGELVTKDEILNRVWRVRVVEENTLQFQISTLRKALGEDRDVVKTISGRGYRFAADLIAQGDPEAIAEGGAAAAAHPRIVPTNLQDSASELIGREADRSEVADQHIGRLFAYSPAEVDGTWPCTAVRELIELVRSRSVERGFYLGVVNKRGATWRRPTDGGVQERELAKNYRKLAKDLRLEWPRSSSVLDQLSQLRGAGGNPRAGDEGNVLIQSGA